MKMLLIGLLAAINLTTLQSCCFSGCPDDIPGNTLTSLYEPILMDRTAFEESVSISNARNIEESGKIYVFSNKLFVNEKLDGFHMFNNQNPSNPINSGFLTVPGATDVSIIDNVLYINQATDLIAVTIDETTSTATVTKRIINTFPPLRSPDGDIAFDIPEDSVVIGWQSIFEN
ncbi:hypothetical protein [Patiriisocius marinus]|nr:hypothetical protein [Patiriisocius marinus]